MPIAPSTQEWLHPQLQETVEQMKLALSQLIEDQQQDASTRRNAFDGQLLWRDGGSYTYACRLESAWDLDENMKIVVHLDPTLPIRIDARVVSVSETMLTLVTQELMREEHLQQFVVTAETVWLLERQHEALSGLRETEAELGAKVLGYLPFTSSKLPFSVAVGSLCLNEQQQQALELALGSERLVIVGPGGTGKSAVLSAITLSCLKLGLSVLTVSHTNIATDNLFLRQVEMIRASEEQDLLDALAQGSVARAGQPRHNSLLSGPSRVLTVDAIAQQRVEMGTERLTQLTQKQQVLKQKRNDQEKEFLRDKRSWGKKRSRLCKKRDVLHKQNDMIPQADEQQQSKQKATKTHLFQRELEEQIHAGEEALEQKKQDLMQTETDLAETQSRLDELSSRVAESKKEVIRQARLITTTVSSAFLNPQLLGRTFDVILVDEISMIPLTGLLIVTTHAEKKVIVAGDPMQLAPIFKTTCTEQERPYKMPEAVKWLGQDLLTHLGITMHDTVTGAKGSILLREQGRTHPAILAPLNQFVYQGMLTSRDETKIAPAIEPLPDCPLLLVDTSHSNAKAYRPRPGSRENAVHIDVIRALVRQIKGSLPELSAEADPSVPRIGVLTPYRRQATRIRQALRAAGLEEGMHIGTINTAQALEFEVTLLDTVDAPGVKLSNFTCDSILDNKNMATGATRLWTVAHSRAKHKLIYIAHADYIYREQPYPIQQDQRFPSLLKELVRWSARVGYLRAEDVLGASHREEMQ